MTIIIEEGVLAPAQTSEKVLTPIVSGWKNYEKFAFRVVFIFVLQLCIPLTARFYNNLFNIDWAHFNWQTVSGLASGLGAPDYIDLPDEDIWGFLSYINLFIALGIAIFIAAIWSILSPNIKHYKDGYYWITVIARYRLAFGIIAWGYKKFVPMQMELPTHTFLNTPFADFSEQKLYWQGVGIAQYYEVFLGFAEVLCGILLLFRKTTALGAALTFVILGNIVIANHAYDGMVHVHSFTYALLALIILWKDLGNIRKLLIYRQDVLPTTYYPSLTQAWQQYGRIGLKVVSSGIFVFFLLYLHLTDTLGYRFPHNSPGLKNAVGLYNVVEFKINGKEVPYDPNSPVRWQDAVFENWSTITFSVNRLQHMDIENTGRETRESISKRFEFRGIGGGRHYFDYKVDPVKQQLVLTNKNRAHRDQMQILHYERPTDTRIVLTGTNEFKDQVYIVLDRIERAYALGSEHQNAYTFDASAKKPYWTNYFISRP